MTDGFMHKYYDWNAFEGFIQSLYEEEGDVTVEHNVTDVDRYGAKRQTDVKITRRARFHSFVTLVECKRWKEPVSRDRIDVLASSIEALGAQNGAVFTTTGFEAGAIAYAKGKGIELFLVRDLSPEEWGEPGRHVSLFLHTISAEFREIGMPDVTAIGLVDEPPTSIHMGVELRQDLAADPEQDLFSVKTGVRGPNLVALLGDAHGLILHALGQQTPLMERGEPCVLEIMAACEVDFRATEFKQLRLPTAALRFETIKCKLLARVSQSHIEIDRGKDLDFAVMVESYASEQRLMAHRKTDDPGVTFQVQNPKALNTADVDTDAFANGSLIKAYCAPWVGFGNAQATKNAVAGQLIRVLVDVIEGKPQLALRSEPLPSASQAVVKPPPSSRS